MAKGGKGSRARSKERRKKERRSQKAQKKALYESYAKSGNNSKGSRTSRKNAAAKKSQLRPISHPDGDCGNIGCRRCFGLIGSKEWVHNKLMKGVYR